MDQVTAREPEEVLSRGLGWAALEKRRAAASGEDHGLPAELPFDDDDLTPDQQPWLALLEAGGLPARDPGDDPGQFQVRGKWCELLERSVADGHSDHWLGWFHLGVMRLEAGDTAGAQAAWEHSLAHAPTAWALRNLAVIQQRAGDEGAALRLLAQALQAGPVVPALAAEHAGALLRLKHFEELDAFLLSLPRDIRQAERLRLASGWAALHAGRLAEVQEVLSQDFATIQEGELTLSELWFALQTEKLARAEGLAVTDDLRARVRRECPPPYAIDFRMSQEGDDKYLPPQAGAS